MRNSVDRRGARLKRKAKSPWPKSGPELAREGYRSDKTWTRCRHCNARVFWAVTPSGARMPMEEAKADDRVRRFQSHFASCPKADNLRRKD